MQKLTLKPYEWFSRDIKEYDYHSVNAWCLDKESKPYLIRFTNFKPSFMIQLPTFVGKIRYRWTASKALDVVNAIKKVIGEEFIFDSTAKLAPMLYYYTQEKYPVIQMWFNTEDAMNRTKNLLKYPVKIYEENDVTEVQCVAWESNISSTLQFLTLARLQYCQWFEVNTAIKVTSSRKISTLDNEYFVDCGKMLKFPQGYTIDKPIPLNPEDNNPWFPVIPIDSRLTKSWVVSPGCLVIDIECYSDNPKALPIKTLKNHVVYMISCIFQKIGRKDTRKRYVIVMGDTTDLPESHKDVIVIKVGDEYELCQALCDVIKEHDPEVISGYNILGFDYPYLNQRMENMVKEWDVKASRLIGEHPKLVTAKKWSSKAYGHTENHFLNFPGRISIDLLPIIKRGHKLPKYDLNTVSNKFVKRGKHDVKASEMFQIYEELVKYKDLYSKCIRTWVKPQNLHKALKILGIKKYKELPVPEEVLGEESLKFIEIIIPSLKPVEVDGLIPIYHENVSEQILTEIIQGYELAKSRMLKVALYCVEDSELVIDIIDKTNTWIGLEELSNVVGVSIVDVFARGQQVRGLSRIYYRLKPKGIVIDVHPPNANSKYSGGYVGDPEPGLYDYVMCLDFASLYPSIMQAYNICYTTFVKPTDSSVNEKDVHLIKCPVLDADGNQVGEVTHRFIKKEVKEGEVPQLLAYLVSERRAVRKEMEKEIEGSLEWVILNERQLALKIFANSIYGMFGVREGAMIALVEGAECVTSIGREKILFCNKYLQEKYGATIVYNDTDSTFFILPYIKDYVSGIKEMNRLAKELSDLMLNPMYLEAEKIGRMFAIKKKKYAFWLVDTDEKMWKDGIKGTVKVPNPNYGNLKDYKKDKYVILVKGILLARRDNFKYIRDTYWDMLTLIMERKPMNEVFKILINNCINLYKGNVPWSDLIIIRQLGAHYKTDSYFMKVFGDEIKKLGRPANAGDRLEYIIVKDTSGTGDQLLGQRLRLPEVYVERIGTPQEDKIDTLYYLENLFKKSIEQLWSVAFNKELKYLDEKYQTNDNQLILEDMKSTVRNGQIVINELINKFSGDVNQTVKYLEEELSKSIETDKELKYLYNKYIMSRRKYVSGRDVFNMRIPSTPIKDMIKSINLGRLDEYVQTVTSLIG